MKKTSQTETNMLYNDFIDFRIFFFIFCSGFKEWIKHGMLEIDYIIRMHGQTG